jgi:hypothetical protein
MLLACQPRSTGGERRPELDPEEHGITDEDIGFDEM